MPETTEMPSCPMAKTCMRMMDKPRAGLWMIVPGVLFIILGVAIVMYPQILVWLVAVALIAMGVGMLMMVNFMRSFGRPHHGAHS